MHFETLKEWLGWQEGLHPQAIDLGLERVTTVLHKLIPNLSKVPRITVAGTNGKGSTIALLAAIYRAQGYRVGAYTSPHILKYNERISINGQAVADDLICDAFARIEACRRDISLSYFEFGTLAALDIFERADLDVQLLEVGLGGRLDAVNIISPDVAMISSIDIDHAEWLGNTRAAIAIEKAGIFRANIPAIVGDPEPPHTLLQAAADSGAELLCIGRAFDYQCRTDTWDWQLDAHVYTHLPFPALKGSHQFRNAASVLAAITKLQNRLPVSEEAIRSGLSKVSLKGRFQLIEGDIPTLLDVGHNPQAVRTLFEYVSQTFPGKRIHALFAIMKDKDIKTVLNIMQPLIHDWVLAPLENPRAANSTMLQGLMEECGIHQYTGSFNDFDAAVNEVEHLAQKGDLILVFGSFFLVSAYLAKLNYRDCFTEASSVSEVNANRQPSCDEQGLTHTSGAVIEGII